MGKGSSKLNCSSQTNGKHSSSDERPYEPSTCPSNRIPVESTQNDKGQAGGAGRAEPEEGRRDSSASVVSSRSFDPRCSVFSPTRRTSEGSFYFPVQAQNGHLPTGNSNNVASYIAQPQLSTDFSQSYVPSDDDDIPYIDRSRPNSSFFSNSASTPWLPQDRGLFSPSQLSLGDMRPRAHSSASCLTHTHMFNFDRCEDVHIGDKSVTNITMERRAEELDNLREISLSKGKRWTKNTHLFQKTHSCEEALKTLKDNGVVVVVGRKGDGKTSIAKTILLQLKKEVEERSDSGNDVILVEVEEPGELVNLCSRNYDATFLVLVDDVFGKSAVDGIKLDKWQRKAEDVWEALNDSNDIKLVMTLRKHVWNKAKPLLQDYDLFSNRIDLTCAEMSLGSKEKASILRAHVEHSERIISDVLVREVSQTIPTPPGFPQCCSMFSTVESLFSQGAQFFRKPSKYLDRLLEELHSSTPNLYLPLALTLMFGGRFSTKNFSKDYLDKNPQVKKTVEEVLECCSTEGKVTLGQLKSSFDMLLDVYFESNENETSFRFNHDSIQEAVACHFGAKYPQVLIKCCRLRSLQQWICTRREDQESYVVYVKQNCFPDLCNRLNADLLEGKANTVFTLLPARDEIFVKGWIKGLENSASLVKKLEVHSSELLIHASKNGVRKFVEFVLSRSWAAPGAEVLAKAVKCAACGGHQDVLEILLDQNPPRIVVTEAFVEVLEVGHVSSARCLLQYYPELLQKQFPDKLDSLQRKQSAKRQNSQRWKKCLHLASYHGCVELVQHFLDRGMDPYVTDSLWKTALHHAAESGYANVVHLLLQIEGDLDKKDKFERTALHYAANEGHVDVVQQLVEAGASVNIVDQNGNTAKCLAESKGFEAVAELLGS